MPGEDRSTRTDKRAPADRTRARALQHMGAKRSGEDCHELVLRLKAQARCLEEILSDIRSQIDEFECDEIIDQIKEKLEAEN